MLAARRPPPHSGTLPCARTRRYAGSVSATSTGADLARAQAQSRRLPPPLVYRKFLRALQWTLRTEELTPKHVTGLKLLWKERLLDPEVQRKRMEGVWNVIDNVSQEQARFFATKEQLVPLRQDEDFYSRFQDKEEEPEEEEVKPLPKEDLPTELQKFIDRRAGQAAEKVAPKDPVKAVQDTVERLRRNREPGSSSERRPPPTRTLNPNVLSARQTTLDDALLHLSVTGDAKSLNVLPTKSVEPIAKLAADRFSKI